ncbi:MAG: hypothetical protein DRN20_01885 [Thermoplasmata archaeon]|nr:MAG: hypothetical protein DRN20_01885 [Thermoplasmata archaeon]
MEKFINGYMIIPVMASSIKGIYKDQIKNVAEVVGRLKNAEERKKLLADDRIEPHIYLLKLLLIVLVLSIIVAFVI